METKIVHEYKTTTPHEAAHKFALLRPPCAVFLYDKDGQAAAAAVMDSDGKTVFFFHPTRYPPLPPVGATVEAHGAGQAAELNGPGYCQIYDGQTGTVRAHGIERQGFSVQWSPSTYATHQAHDWMDWIHPAPAGN